MFHQAFSCYLVCMLCFYNNNIWLRVSVQQSCDFFLKRYEIMMYLKKDKRAFKKSLETWMIKLRHIYKLYYYQYSDYGRRFRWIDNDANRITLAEFEIFIAYNCKCINQRFSYYIYRNIEDFYGRYPYLEKLNKTPTISDEV